MKERRIFRNNQTAREGYAAFLQNTPIRSGAYPGFYPGAGMSRPVGAFNTQNAPIRCGLEGVYEVPICRCGEPLARGYNRNG
jgi:hypothetical protein